MDKNHKLTLYISYYLSRFNNDALVNLNYSTWNGAFEDIGKKLNVKPNSVRNWRDEFDPLFGYREGWHRRPMAPSRTNVALALENLEEPEIRAIVEEILTSKIFDYPENLNHLLRIPDHGIQNNNGQSFVLRGPTGKKAEQFFVDYYHQYHLPVNGELIDTRDLGCGYDFEIKPDRSRFFVEVKGLANSSGGILFTNKEWENAKLERENYIVCIVSNLNESPEVKFIHDPFSRLNPRKNIIQAIQVQWSISSNEINSLNA